jgi:hypothetical protein
MFRWLFVCLLLSGGAYGLIAFLTGKLPGYPTTSTATTQPVQAKHDNAKPPDTEPQGSTQDREAGGLRDDPLPPVDTLGGTTVLPQPIVITGGTILMRQQQEVPSEREGKIVFIGVEVKPGEEVPPEKVIETYRYYLAVLCKSVPSRTVKPWRKASSWP